MNIFEGSRRIAYLAGGLAVAGTLIYAVTYEPYISIDYSISHPRADFQRMNESCPTEAGRTFFTTTSQSGTSVSIDLCLLTMEFGEDKRQLVPYKINEKNMTWGAASYSSEVSAYEKQLKARFVLPPEDNNWVDKERSRRYWENWKESLRNLGIGLAIFAGFVWAIGWIVRGFMGVPRGLDRKPNIDA
ncbi:MAG: hypothetical protein NTY69_03555 [Methylococcales bacterium]|nr:hypothetical protein [Methylococcales bacterium]